MKPSERVASTAELKARLSHYLRIVRRGDRVLVTHRGQPVASLEPIRAEHADERIARLIAAGRARPPRGRLPGGFWDEPAPADPEGRALSALLQERLDSR